VVGRFVTLKFKIIHLFKISITEFLTKWLYNIVRSNN
jgi:hypothetical protein